MLRNGAEGRSQLTRAGDDCEYHGGCGEERRAMTVTVTVNLARQEFAHWPISDRRSVIYTRTLMHRF